MEPEMEPEMGPERGMGTRRLGAALLTAWASTALAGGIDRSGQGLGALFEPGRHLELSIGHAAPSVKGTDLAGGPTGDVVGDHAVASLSAKFDVNRALSLAVVLEQTYGADLVYGRSSTLLGGTLVDEASHALLGLARYRLNDGFSVHGGLRAQRSSAEVRLAGLAYGPVNGYRVQLGPDTETGWVAGLAWEKPEIALRLALTWHGAIEHRLDTVETGPLIDPDGPGPASALPLLNGASTTRIRTPRAINLDFKTGVAPDLLLFGQMRWANWSEFRVDPARFLAVTGEGLIELDDTRTYTLGLARRFDERWTGAVSLNYEAKGGALVSPLAPIDGRQGITLAVIHSRDGLTLTTGVSYVRLGDARLETGTPDTHRATMGGNSALGVGVKLGWAH